MNSKTGSRLAAYVSGIYVFLYLPLAVMFAFSFNNARRNVAWTGFTMKWYGRLFHDAELMKALFTTLNLALTAGVIASLLGLLSSYAMTRHKAFAGRNAYNALLNIPLMMPEVVLGVGLLSFLVRARVPLNFWTLACAHALIALPYASASIRARLLSLKDSRYEEAAMDLGATAWQAFCRVTLPLARPAIFSGGLLAFTVSFQDFVTSFFIAGIGIVTMPIKIYSMMKFGVTPEINALSSCLLALTFLALAGGSLLKSTKSAKPHLGL